MKSAIHHFAGADVGGLMNVSGAAVLKSLAQPGRGRRNFWPSWSASPRRRWCRSWTSPSNTRWLAGVAANPILKPIGRIAAAGPDPQADRRRSGCGQTAERGGPDLMTQVASLNAAQRGSALVAARAVERRARRSLVGAAAFAAALVLLPIWFTIIQAAGVSAQDAVDLLMRPLVGAAACQHGRLGGRGVRDMRGHRRRRPRGLSSGRICRAERSGPCSPSRPWPIPPFISSYAWVSLSNGLQDFAGALLVVTCAYYPLVYLPVAAALRGLDPGAGRDRPVAGAGAWGCFFRVVAAATSSGSLRRHIARRARHADRVRRVFAAALSHLHHRALRPIPDRTGRARNPRCWRSSSSRCASSA